MEKISLSICTPTYNRCDYLLRVYDSLKIQTEKNFEWIIIDDGSTDSTSDYVKSIIKDNELRITYHKKPNGGKHRAVNVGIDLAKAPWFMILDSDDYLAETAVENYLSNLKKIEGSHVKGLVCLRVDQQNVVIGDEFPDDLFESNFIERQERNIQGDKCEIICTKLMKETKFPEFEGENFLAESSLWIKISEKNKFRFLNLEGYICNYQKDGLTANSLKNRYANPQGSSYIYALQYRNYKKWSYRLKAAINFWRFATFNDNSLNRPSKIFYPLGIFMRTYDREWRCMK